MSALHIDPVNVRKRLVGAIALPLLLMGLLAGVLFWQIRHLIKLENWVEHSDQAIINAQQAQKLFLDMQLGWRGYFITGRAEYLLPYRAGADKIDRSLAELAGIVADNPTQVARVGDLRAVQAEWAAFGREVIALKEENGDTRALIEQGRGEILRDKLNELFAGFIQTETRLRDERTRAARAATQAVLRTAVGLMVLIGCIIAFFSRKQLLEVSENYRRSLANEQDQARAVQESQDRYQAFLHNSTEAIWRCELTTPVSLDQPEDVLIDQFYERGYLAECNDVLARMYGYGRAEDLVGARLADLLVRSDPENEAYFRNFIRAGFRLTDAESIERDRDGNIKHFLNNLVGIVESGRLVRAWGTQRDVTEQKQLEEERARIFLRERQARADAEAANAAKDEFLAILSHELRTPLTPIIGWVRMMDEGMVEGDDLRRGLSVIKRNSLALSQLINDLLDMSAIMSGKLRVARAPVGIDAVIADAAETLRPLAAGREVSIVLTRCSPSPASTVVGDRTRLTQVFWNLLHNAIKFSARGGRVSVVCEETVGPEIRVHIEDEGQGIAADFLPHVFDRFRQEDSSTTRSHGGLGIGLALVKSFVEAHHGSVSAASRGAGLGSRFTVTLPLQPEAAEDESSPPDEAPAGEAKTTHSLPAVKEQLRAMIVEDAEDTLAMLDTLFTRYNFQTTLCPTPEVALRAAADGQYELIVCDIGLPGIDGYELINRFRQMPHLRGVPAVALTGFAGPKEQEKALAAGFDEHIAKPVTPPVLMAKLEELFKAKAPR